MAWFEVECEIKVEREMYESLLKIYIEEFVGFKGI